MEYCKVKMEASHSGKCALSGSDDEEEGTQPPKSCKPSLPNSPSPLPTPEEKKDEDKYTPPADDEGGQAEPPAEFAGPPPAALVHCGGLEGRLQGEASGASAAAAPAFASDIGDLGEPGCSCAEHAAAPPPLEKPCNCIDCRARLFLNKVLMLKCILQQGLVMWTELKRKHDIKLAILHGILNNSSDGTPVPGGHPLSGVDLDDDELEMVNDVVKTAFASNSSFSRYQAWYRALARHIMGDEADALLGPADP